MFNLVQVNLRSGQFCSSFIQIWPHLDQNWPDLENFRRWILHKPKLEQNWPDLERSPKLEQNWPDLRENWSPNAGAKGPIKNPDWGVSPKTIIRLKGFGFNWNFLTESEYQLKSVLIKSFRTSFDLVFSQLYCQKLTENARKSTKNARAAISPDLELYDRSFRSSRS